MIDLADAMESVQGLVEAIYRKEVTQEEAIDIAKQYDYLIGLMDNLPL